MNFAENGPGGLGHGDSTAVIYAFGDCQVDTMRFELFRDGQVVPVEPQVLELLIFLIEHRDRAVTRDELFASIWKGRVVSDTTLSSRIRSARHAIGDDGTRQQFIKTIHGRGFRFVGSVKAGDAAGNAPGPRNPEVEPIAAPPRPATRYARSGDVHVAYQVFGEGPVNLVLTPGFVSHIDNYWDEPRLAGWLSGLGRIGRVAMFDKRGTGMSDRVTDLPDMDERMDDVRAVLDAAGFDTAFIMGISEGGSLATLYSAHHPERCEGLILYGAFAQFRYWYHDGKSLQALFEYIETDWGSGNSLPAFAPSVADEPGYRNWWGKFERLGATPGAAIALMTMNSEIDILEVLASVHVPTLVIHRAGDVLIDVAAGRELARRIPGAQYLEIAGDDHLPWVGNADEIVAAIDSFVGTERVEKADRVLATVVLIRLDPSPSDAAKRAEPLIRAEAARFRTTGVTAAEGGTVVTFDGPTRALECAVAMSKALRNAGLTARIGAHTGEIDSRAGPAGTVALRIAAEVCAEASAGEVLLSRTVRDLVAGSGVALRERGKIHLPAVDEEWRLFDVMKG